MSRGRLGQLLAVNIGLCFTEIVSNRVRTVITSFGIFLGIGALLTNLAFLRAMEDNVQENLERMGGLNIVTINAVEPVGIEEQMLFQRSPGLTVGEVQRLTADIPYVEKVMTSAELGWPRVVYRGKGRRGRGMAVGQEYAQVFNYTVGKGSWFTREDIDRARPVCVIGEGIAERIFADGQDPIGERVSIGRMVMRVVGVIETEARHDRRSRECFVPFTYYQRQVSGYGRKVESVTVLLTGSEHASKAQRLLTTRLLTAHRGIADFEVQLNEEKIAEQQNAMVGLQAVLWSIAVISLVGGGVSIMNIMFATIGDRIREIGIRKALGARREDVFAQFFTEAILVCFVGGTPGLLLGLIVTSFPEGMFPFQPRLTWIDYVVALGFTMVAGMLSGLVPALKASGMRPVDALRY